MEKNDIDAMLDIGDLSEVPEEERVDYDDPSDYDHDAPQDFEVEEGEIIQLRGKA